MSKLVLATLALLLSATFMAPTAGATGDRTSVVKPAAISDTVVQRDKPRVPGGSGCDDPDDIIEHPECLP